MLNIGNSIFVGHDDGEEDKDNEALREEALPTVAQKKPFNPRKFRETVKKGDCILG